MVEHDPRVAAQIGNYTQIISFRNLLIHGYDLIDDQQVWQVIQNDLRVLIAAVEGLLAERDGGEPSS